jgi:hypothetical protein
MTINSRSFYFTFFELVFDIDVDFQVDVVDEKIGRIFYLDVDDGNFGHY